MTILATWEKEEVVWYKVLKKAVDTWKVRPIAKICIYMSNEKPSIIVNTDNFENPPKENWIRFDLKNEPFFGDEALEEGGRGFFKAMNLLTIRKSVKRYLGNDYWNVNGRGKTSDQLRESILRESEYWDEDEGFDDKMLEFVLSDTTGAKVLAEVAWVYRLAIRLQTDLKDVQVTVAIHDVFEGVNKKLWRLASEYKNKPLKLYLSHFGFIGS